MTEKSISPPLNQTNIDVANSIVKMYEKNGRVYVQGFLRNKNQLSSGSDVVVMTLPSQYRPKDTRMPWSIAYCYDLHATMLFYCDDSYNLKILKPSASILAGSVIVVNTSWEI